MGQITPLPLKTMCILCIVILSEPISLTILFPFVYFLVKDFGIETINIGYYVGYIASAFGIAQFLTSMWWGALSDRIGRRPVLLMGLFGSAMAMVGFGLSTSLLMAVSMRFLCGFLNGNIGVAKCVLIGPVLGGLLIHPAKNFPLVFGNFQLFIHHPYLLPCLVSASVSMIGFTIGVFYLPETLKRPTVVAEVGERRPLLLSFPSINSVGDCDSLIENADSSSAARHSESTLVPNHSILTTTDQIGQPSDPVAASETIGKGAALTSVAYAILAFQSILFIEVFPLWAVSPIGIGLGFTAAEIGMVLGSIGIFNLISLLAIYPTISRHFTALALFRIPMIPLLLCYASVPLISTCIAPYPALDFLVKPLLIIIFGAKAFFESTAFTSAMILINLSARPGMLGRVNGAAQCSAAFARSIAPLSGGSLWAWSNSNGLPFPLNHHFIFIIIMVIVVMLLTQACGMLKEEMYEY